MQDVLVINHWGGVPAALLETLCAAQGWAKHVARKPQLGRLERAESAWTVFRSMREASRAGYRTFVLGCHGQNIRHTADPRVGVDGIDRFSLVDGSKYQHAAYAHDEEVIGEATRILDDTERSNVFIVLNLLSCRDVDRVRFRTSTRFDVVKGRSHSSIDQRIMPKTLEVHVPDVTEPCAKHDRTQHGESADVELRLKDVQGEYAALLDVAWETLRRVERGLSELVQRPDMAIAHTATHVLSMGEHLARGGSVLTSTCCDTFWCSNVPLTNRDRYRSLARVFADFVQTACGVTVSFVDERGVSTTPAIPDAERRVELVNDHAYACVIRGGRLVSVHDLDVDPDETENVIEDVAHLHGSFHAPPVVRTVQRPPPIEVPPPKSPDVVVDEQPKIKVETARRRTVRDREKKLNILHR